EAAYPFLDRDLISFLISIPGEMLCPDGVPKGILRRALRGTLPDSIATRRWKGRVDGEVRQGFQAEFETLYGLLNGDSTAVREGYMNRGNLDRGLDTLRVSFASGRHVDIFSVC